MSAESFVLFVYDLMILFGGVFLLSSPETSSRKGCTRPATVKPTEAARGLASYKVWPCQ